MNRKLTVKALIVAGAFAALYLVVMLIVVMGAGFIPILLLSLPLLLSVVCGPIYMLYVMKVPKRGAVLILSILAGLAMLSSGMWLVLLYVGPLLGLGLRQTSPPAALTPSTCAGSAHSSGAWRAGCSSRPSLPMIRSLF